jgi:hypothetical protein
VGPLCQGQTVLLGVNQPDMKFECMTCGSRSGWWVGPDCHVGMAGGTRLSGGDCRWDPLVRWGWWEPHVNLLDTKSEYMTCGSQTYMSIAAICKLN